MNKLTHLFSLEDVMHDQFRALLCFFMFIWVNSGPENVWWNFIRMFDVIDDVLSVET